MDNGSVMHVDAGQVQTLTQRLSKVMLDVSSSLADSGGGALVQVWMPEHCADGSVVLSAQGLPFSISGVGDLLALYRCVSVRYRFSTDVMKPSLMGAIGRVYSSMEPEMSNNVQQYDKQVYLRVSEAQRCRVHSTLVVPLYSQDSSMLHKPIAIFELVQSDKDCPFPTVMAHLRRCLEAVKLYTCDLHGTPPGLQKWALRLEEPMLSAGAKRPGSSRKSFEEQQHQQGGAGWSGRAPGMRNALLLAPKVEVHGESSAENSGGASGGSNKQPRGRLSDEDPSGVQGVSKPSGVLVLNAGSREYAGLPIPQAAAADHVPGMATSQQARELAEWMAENKFGPDALESIKNMLQNTSPRQQMQQLQQNADAGVQGHHSKQQGHGQQRGDEPRVGSSLGRNSAQPAASTLQVSRPQQQQQQQQSEARNRATMAGPGRLDADGNEEISSDGDSDDSDGERGDKGSNRVGGGAGKRLRYEDLQAQFGLGLKEAAANMGICATTLKRACRRHGIKRWPRRQIAKLSKALTQMGYQGAPPPLLVQSAVKGQLQQQQPEAAADLSSPSELHIQKQREVQQMQLQAQQMQRQAQQMHQELQMQEQMQLQLAQQQQHMGGMSQMQGGSTGPQTEYAARSGMQQYQRQPQPQPLHQMYSEFAQGGNMHGGMVFPATSGDLDSSGAPHAFPYRDGADHASAPGQAAQDSWQRVPSSFLQIDRSSMPPPPHLQLQGGNGAAYGPCSSRGQSQSFLSLPTSDFMNGSDLMERMDGGNNVEATSVSRLAHTAIDHVADAMHDHGGGCLTDLLHDDVGMSL